MPDHVTSTLSRARVAGFAVAVFLALAGPAAAHPGHNSRIIVEDVSPAVKGVEVTAVSDGVGKIRLATSGSTVAEVLGNDGEPILRIGPGGVDANTASPDWYRVNEPLGIAEVPPTAKPGAPVQWVRVSAVRRWEWFDHRFHPSAKPIFQWAIPLRVDGKPAKIRGHIAASAGTFQITPATAGLPAGVTVTGISGPLPSIKVANDGRKPVTVLAPGGEPFARIGHNGTKINVRSSVWVPTAQTGNRSLLDSVIDPSAQPKFELVSPTADLIWPDPRVVPTPAQVNAGKGSKWTFPLETADGKRVTVSGSTKLVAAKPEPSPSSTPVAAATATAAGADSGGGSGSTTAILLGAAAGIVLLAGVALVARRRGRTRV
jgi:hypothetical protein